MLLLQGCVALEVVRTGASLGSLYFSHQVYVASDCDWVKPIYLEGSVEGMTDKDLRGIVVHNEAYREFCN
jgi:hypothetical protein